MVAVKASKTSFGRHETFPLRFGWLAKGFGAWCESDGIFDDEEDTVRLGVGKNMVSAIRYWLQATRVVTAKERVLTPTPLGRAVFARGGFDPYLEDDGTIWLLHWLLASNREDATTIYWFFNRFHKAEFSSEELHTNLRSFVAEEVPVSVAEGTLRNDVNLLLRMYEGGIRSRDLSLEDSLDSPLTLLDLIQPGETNRHHVSFSRGRRRIPEAILGYAVAEVFATANQPTLTLRQLMTGDTRLAGIGSIFRLTEDALLAKVEQLLTWCPGHYEFRDTAGVRQLYQLQRLNPMDALTRYYGRAALRRAA